MRRGGAGRLDAESETLIPISLGGSFDDAQCVTGDVTHALTTRCGGRNAGEDGTGRGTPIIPVAFDTTQITSKTNRCQPEAGDPCHPLAAGAHAPAIAFSCKDHGADASDDISPTLRAMGHTGSHPNAGGQMAIATSVCLGSDPLSACDLAMPQTQRNGDPGVVQFGSAVRRLTPRECERLQGYPDDFTAITYRGKPASDGPRYKALGNSMAVAVMRWILRRVAAADAALAPDLREAAE